MPEISRAEVAHLADLARIDLDDAELDHLAPQLAVILDSIASIREAGVTIAPVNPAKITANVTTFKSTIPAPTVLATAVPNPNAATKLKNAAQTTAFPGVSTRVETTVAIEFAAS